MPSSGGVASPNKRPAQKALFYAKKEAGGVSNRLDSRAFEQSQQPANVESEADTPPRIWASKGL